MNLNKGFTQGETRFKPNRGRNCPPQPGFRGGKNSIKLPPTNPRNSQRGSTTPTGNQTTPQTFYLRGFCKTRAFRTTQTHPPLSQSHTRTLRSNGSRSAKKMPKKPPNSRHYGKRIGNGAQKAKNVIPN
ncbi:hypothetical protein BGS_0101 [Beggiatoa sp. SS]|nr:hypothetical protein BGS_0101 [Beggiatoa sp. SS]